MESCCSVLLPTVKRYLTWLSFQFVVMGTCLPTFGAKQGEMCERDSDCESGLICSGSDIKTCAPVKESKRQYGKQF